jgi:hypothetical protein
MLGWIEDAGLLLVLVLAIPVAVIVAGAPLVLLARLLVEVGRRL